jgi:hypothetical protein
LKPSFCVALFLGVRLSPFCFCVAWVSFFRFVVCRRWALGVVCFFFFFPC